MSVEKVAAFFAALKGGIIALVLLAAVAAAAVFGWRYEHAQNLKNAALVAELRAKVDAIVATTPGAAVGTVVKEGGAIAGLTPRQKGFVAAVKKADKGATVSAAAETTVSIKDTAKGAATPTSWSDEYGRFHVDLPSGLLHREQKFKFGVVVLRGTDGEYQTISGDFREFSPKTGDEIPSKGATLETTFKVIEQKEPGPGRFHLRGVFGIDQRAGIGGGAQINPWKGLTVGVLGLYSPKEREGRAVIHAGWRLFGSTISLGPYGGVSTKGGVVFGAAATIELTR